MNTTFGFDFEFDATSKKWTVTEASTLNTVHLNEEFFKTPYDKMQITDYDHCIADYMKLLYPEVMDYVITGIYPEHGYLRFIVEAKQIEEQYSKP